MAQAIRGSVAPIAREVLPPSNWDTSDRPVWFSLQSGHCQPFDNEAPRHHEATTNNCMMAITVAAMMTDRLVPAKTPCNATTPIGSVIRSRLLISTKGAMKLFQLPVNVMMPSAASAGPS